MTTRAEVLNDKFEGFKRYLAKVGDPQKMKSVEDMNLSKETLLGWMSAYVLPNRAKLDDPASELIIRLGISDVKEHRDKLKRYLECFVCLLTE